MTQNLVSKVGFAPQTAVNESASISKASSFVETNEALETWSSVVIATTTQKHKQILRESLFPLVQHHQVICEAYKIILFST